MSGRPKLSKIKILLLGAVGVGKTAFAVRYITKRFIGEYDTSKEMVYTHKTTLDKEDVTLDILDVSSDTESVLAKHIKWADGVVLVYSVTDRQSFTKLDFYHSLIQHYTRHHDDDDDSLPLVLVANKTDSPSPGRTVSRNEGDKISRRFDCHKFEISVAESAEDAPEVMEYLLSKVCRQYQKSPSGMGRRLPVPNVIRVFKKKIYRSRSDTPIKKKDTS